MIMKIDLQPRLGPSAFALPNGKVVLAATADGLFLRAPSEAGWRHFLETPRLQSLASASQRQALFVNTTPGQVWRSGRDGRAWSRADRGLPHTPWAVPWAFVIWPRSMGRTDFVPRPRKPATIYALKFPDLYQTTDGGVLWRRTWDRRLWGSPTALAFDGSDPAGMWLVVCQSSFEGFTVAETTQGVEHDAPTRDGAHSSDHG